MLLGHLPKFFVESWSNNRGVKPPLLTHTLPSRHPNSASCQASRPSRSSQSSAAFLVKSLAEGPAETQSDIHSERRQTADTSDAENRCGNAVNAPGLHQCRRHIYWKVHCGATTADGGRADAQPSSGKFQVVRLHLQQLEAAHCDAEAPVTAAAAAAEQNPAGVAVIVGRFAPAAAQTAAVPAAAAAAAAVPVPVPVTVAVPAAAAAAPGAALTDPAVELAVAADLAEHAAAHFGAGARLAAVGEGAPRSAVAAAPAAVVALPAVVEPHCAPPSWWLALL